MARLSARQSEQSRLELGLYRKHGLGGARLNCLHESSATYSFTASPSPCHDSVSHFKNIQSHEAVADRESENAAAVDMTLTGWTGFRAWPGPGRQGTHARGGLVRRAGRATTGMCSRRREVACRELTRHLGPPWLYGSAPTSRDRPNSGRFPVRHGQKRIPCSSVTPRCSSRDEGGGI
jgi:hypothetical protein